jgi:hypothetical protein
MTEPEIVRTRQGLADYSVSHFEWVFFKVKQVFVCLNSLLETLSFYSVQV